MEELKNITWLGHASFYFTENGNRIYYIDPFDFKQQNLQKGDIVFITHAHYDHCSYDDVKKILKNDTQVVAPIDCLEKLKFPEEQQFPVSPNQQYTVKGFSFLTTPAYNTYPGKKSFHPKANNWVGYVLTINGKKIYHAGDTDFIPEMETLKAMHLDVALLPIGGTYVMDVDDAIKAANAIAAKVTIPMHYKRLLPDTYKDAENEFQKGVTNSKVVVLQELQ